MVVIILTGCPTGPDGPGGPGGPGTYVVKEVAY